MIEERLQNIVSTDPAVFARLNRGIEKESLRVNSAGHLAETPHPAAIGAALTHPQITTDFSEAQLELITGVHHSADAVLDELRWIHRAVHQHLTQGELMWGTSMPCMLRGEDHIPIGRYGTSHVGRTKSIYRRGLANRYGALMQTISGIHYNFSVPTELWQALYPELDAQTAATTGYLALIRNFRRHAWLLLYLLGASPAICRTFVGDRDHGLEHFGAGTLYLPHATSLRMGRLGYRSDAQSRLHVSYNSLDDYADALYGALTEPYPEYRRIGVRDNAGQYAQLNDCLLQIENEFYGTIRPKRTTQSGERPLHALRERGVEYVEVRCVDLNPFEPVGINAQQVRMLDTFLMHCLLMDSPPDSLEEDHRMGRNQLKVVERGREPGLELETADGPRELKSWALAILDECAAVARTLDGDTHGAHCEALAQHRAAVEDPSLTPSARILQTLTDSDLPFFRCAMELARDHADALRHDPLSAEELAAFSTSVEQSLVRQREIEAADTGTYEEYLAGFLEPSQLAAQPLQSAG